MAMENGAGVAEMTGSMPAAGAADPAVVTAADVVADHVSLDISCLDRLYLTGFVARLQTPGGVIYFLHDHRGRPIASPALFEPIGEKFRREIRDWAQAGGLPVVRFRAGERKADVMSPYLEAAAAAGRSAVVAIGCAREFQSVWTARRRDTDPGMCPQFSFTREQRRVSVFYVCIFDAKMGPGFIKICTYFPYPVKVWVNGHEWAKRQALAAGIGFTELSKRVRLLRGSGQAAADLRQLRPRHRAGVVRPLDGQAPAPAHRRRPRRRVLVGPVDAADRDLPHPGLRLRRPRPRVLRGAAVRQHGPGPPGERRAAVPPRPAVRPADPPAPPRRLQDEDRPVLRPGHRERVLQELPAQAVPQRRRRAADRNGRERPEGPALQPPAAQ